MKFYLAGSWSRRSEFETYKRELEARGHTVTSSWVNAKENDDNDDGVNITLGVGGRFLLAATNLEDIKKADTIIAFTEEPGSSMTRGGRHVEVGYAMAMEMYVWVVGPEENIFYVMAHRHLNSFQDVLDLLDGRGH